MYHPHDGLNEGAGYGVVRDLICLFVIVQRALQIFVLVGVVAVNEECVVGEFGLVQPGSLLFRFHNNYP